MIKKQGGDLKRELVGYVQSNGLWFPMLEPGVIDERSAGRRTKLAVRAQLAERSAATGVKFVAVF